MKFMEKPINLRLTEETRKKLEELAGMEKYDSMGHAIRVAIMKLYEQEKGGM